MALRVESACGVRLPTGIAGPAKKPANRFADSAGDSVRLDVGVFSVPDLAVCIAFVASHLVYLLCCG
jgi:hypothetical protein